MKSIQNNGFSQKEVEAIRKRFCQWCEKGQRMSLKRFKSWMGLLGIGIFHLIANHNQKLGFQDFINFLDTITNGQNYQKAKVSFMFLDRNRKGRLELCDIQLAINQMCLVWNFLTEEKIYPDYAIEILSSKLGISNNQSITFDDYLIKYDQQFSWFEYFSNTYKNNKNEQLPILQIEQYLKFMHQEVTNMIHSLREIKDQQTQNTFSSQCSIIKGPMHVSSQSFKLKGDTNRDSIKFINSQQLSNKLKIKGNNQFQIIGNKISQIKKIGYQLIPSLKKNNNNKSQNYGVHRISICKIKQYKFKKQNLVYIGHQNWNLMLNLMLGLRKAMKSHLYLHKDLNSHFTSQDLGSKYAYDLIYKKNQQSVQQICQIFVDYTPKVFSFIRKIFQIQNNDILKSVGLQSLLGNLMMGNLSTLTNQTETTSQSCNFTYYTDDLKLIVKSISKQQSHTLRSLIQPYCKYIKNNKQTFLPHIYGHYKLKNKSTNRQIYFIVVNNVFSSPHKLQYKYQIKGDLNELQSQQKNLFGDIELVCHKRNFQLQPQDKQKIFSQIKSDVLFLEDHNIIDYGLQIAATKETSSKQYIEFGYKSKKSQIYFLGLFNILIQTSTSKIIQSSLKSIFSRGSSYLNPKQYRERFLSFIAQYIFSY